LVEKQTGEKAFTKSDANGLDELLRTKFKAKEYDEGLIAAVKCVRFTLWTNLRDRQPSSPPSESQTTAAQPWKAPPSAPRRTNEGSGPTIIIGLQVQPTREEVAARASQPNRGFPWSPVNGFAPTEAQTQAHEAWKNDTYPGWGVQDKAIRDTEAQKRGLPRDPQLSQAELDELWSKANQTIQMRPGPQRDKAVSDLFQQLVAQRMRSR
jgi:hypothetical protein